MLGIHSDMLSLYNNEMQARSTVDMIESGDGSGAVDHRTGLIRRRSGWNSKTQTEGEEEVESASQTGEVVNPLLRGKRGKAEVPRLKRVIKRAESNRLKLRAAERRRRWEEEL